MTWSNRRRQLLIRYILSAAFVLLVAFVGYVSSMIYPMVTRPSTAGSGLIILAIAAGLASLFSPCSFPLLLTLLAREATHSKTVLLKTAVAFTVGVVTFLILLGSALAAGAGPVISQVAFTSNVGRILRFSVGLILLGFGLWQIQGKSLSFVWLNQLLQPLWQLQTRWRRKSTSLGYGLYGFGYILAGFGWTGPILAGLALHALTVADETAAFVAFFTAASTIAMVMIMLVWVIGLTHDQVVISIKGKTRLVKRGSGIILMVVGTWLVFLSIWADLFKQLLFPS